jgi:hypothetical protein
MIEPRCDLKCLAGVSAHPENWYCPECAQQEEILRLERERDEARATLIRAVNWWLEKGMHHFEGAPEWLYAAQIEREREVKH